MALKNGGAEGREEKRRGNRDKRTRVIDFSVLCSLVFRFWSKAAGPVCRMYTTLYCVYMELSAICPKLDFRIMD